MFALLSMISHSRLTIRPVGVSAKRTLRERYKQNFENNNLLGDVDYMVLITLGIDLNKDKMDNILAKKVFLLSYLEMFMIYQIMNI